MMTDVSQPTAAWALHPELSLLKISGPDRVTFLQRQTTQDIRLVSPTYTATTCLTEANARLIEVFDVFGGERSLLALPYSGEAQALASYFKKKIFFMDQVTMEVLTDFAAIDLEGPQASEHLAALHLPNLEANLGQTSSAGEPPDATSIWVYLRHGVLADHAYRIIAPTTKIMRLATSLTLLAPQLSNSELEFLRIKARVPRAGHEITPDYTPLEIGLEWAISDSKGCYTGQEVIARQITYDKVTRKLVLFSASAPLTQQSILYVGDRRCGQVTSVAKSPAGEFCGLAVVNKSCLASNEPLTALIGSNAVPVKVWS